MNTNEITPENTYAAIDLGSNSFHMAVAGATGSHLQMIDKVRRPVRLGSGLDKNNNITTETLDRALECLALFQHRLRGVPRDQIRAVGTNTMRRARNSEKLNLAAQQLLGIPIEIISGREEARLIYTGVTYGLRDKKKRLVIDIGGGSTEFIAGQGIEPKVMESVNMGCVSANQRWFSGKDLNLPKQFEKAIKQAQVETRPLTSEYLGYGWEHCIGSSGTIKAAERILTGLGFSKSGINHDHLQQAVNLIGTEGLEVISHIESISADRHTVILGGLSVLLATFRSLDIESMTVSHSALREGVIVDLAGDTLNEHVRHSAVREMQRRFQIDIDQAHRVSTTANAFYQSVRKPWNLGKKADASTLLWATELHEIGLSVSHAQYHKHGDYLLRHADMLGFSRKDQAILASLVRNHRRKITLDVAGTMPENEQQRYHYLLSILRLAVLFHRTRGSGLLPTIEVTAKEDALTLGIANQWLADNPLTDTDLQDEIKRLNTLNITLLIDRLQI